MLSLDQILNLIVPQQFQEEYDEMKADPRSYFQSLKDRPQKVDVQSLLNVIPLMGGVQQGARAIGSKVFKDAPKAVAGSWQDILMDIISKGQPLRRSSMRPAIRTGSGDVVVGSTAGGHGALWEAISPAQQKGAVDGYVDALERFMSRDQGTIASGSLDAIKRALQNTFLE